MYILVYPLSPFDVECYDFRTEIWYWITNSNVPQNGNTPTTFSVFYLPIAHGIGLC